MIKNKKILFVIIILAIVGIVLMRNKSQAPDSRDTSKQESHQHEGIEYWTCSMHPQVRQGGPGKCPICGMNLIPVKATDKGKIIVDEKNQTYLGIKSVPVERRHLVKQIRLPAKIGHDFELYRLQQEYLSAVSILDSLKDLSEGVYQRQLSLVDTAALRLKLLGFNEEQLNQLRERKEADKALIYPDHAKTWAQADVYEQDIKLVKPEQKVILKVKGYQKEFSGTVFAIEEVLDPQTRSATARIVLESQGVELKHGAYADLTLDIDLGHQYLSVPTLSVIDTGSRKVVYIDEGDGRYQLREVKTGIEANGYVQIEEGLNEGEKVVTNGNFFLDSQTTLTGGQSLLYSGSEEVDKAPQQHRH